MTIVRSIAAITVERAPGLGAVRRRVVTTWSALRLRLLLRWGFQAHGLVVVLVLVLVVGTSRWWVLRRRVDIHVKVVLGPEGVVQTGYGYVRLECTS